MNGGWRLEFKLCSKLKTTNSHLEKKMGPCDIHGVAEK
jgi:hypothetical protein